MYRNAMHGVRTFREELGSPEVERHLRDTDLRIPSVTRREDMSESVAHTILIFTRCVNFKSNCWCPIRASSSYSSKNLPFWKNRIVSKWFCLISQNCFSNGVNSFHALFGMYSVRGSYPGSAGRSPSLSRGSTRKPKGSSAAFFSDFCLSARFSAAVRNVLPPGPLEDDSCFRGGREGAAVFLEDDLDLDLDLDLGSSSSSSRSRSLSSSERAEEREDMREEAREEERPREDDASTSSSSSSMSSGTRKSSSSRTFFRPS